MEPDILQFAGQLLTECCNAPPQEKSARRDAFGGPLWSIRVPVQPWIVTKIIDYAREDQRFLFNGGWVSLSSIAGTAEGVVVTMDGGARGMNGHASLSLSYPPDMPQLQRLCMGQWTGGANGQVRLKRLKPDVVKTAFGCEILIDAEARREIKGWFVDRTIEADIKSIQLWPTRARLVTSSRWKTFVLPDVVFVNPDAPMEVEASR